VDLHPIPGAVATAAEQAAIDHALGTATPARHLLLPVLHAVQSRVGWISPGALNHVCERLQVPPAEAYGVASFYALFAMAPRPGAVVHVCDDIACRARGAEAACQTLEQRLGPASEPALSGTATWLRSPCLGFCEHAPAALFQRAGETPEDWTVTGLDAPGLIEALGKLAKGGAPGAEPPIALSAPQTGTPRAPGLRILRRVGLVDPRSLDDYRAHGGYRALRRALAIGPERVLREVADSKLVGRGGAAFPTGRKWEAVARAPVRPHYLVCNADESEPGTFKDRVLMEGDPFALIEAMTIAGYATGCERGYIYIRGEYPRATTLLAGAIAQARERGLLGARITGLDGAGRAGFEFDLELRRGAGAYICGEETALFNSIEGLRGEPRNKPPFPVQSGLFGKPTVINNVETLVSVLDIVTEGGPAYAGIGTQGSSGSKLFCVSGSVARPGVYEIPFGMTLRALIELAGGVVPGRRIQAVLLGGAAGVFVTPQELDMPLTFEGTKAAGATLGSGVVMVFDERVDLKDTILRIAEFFHHESCGQCVPCRVGTIRQEEVLQRMVAADAAARDDVLLLDDLAAVMRDASICGLGHTAASAVQSALRKFPLFQAKAEAPA
jgi:NADH-quinone oxidoreductase subunit F